MLCCWWAQVQQLASFSLLILAPVAGLFVLLRLILIAKRSWNRDSSGRQLVGIFHPYCNAGGGGERVLWAIVQVLQTKFPALDVVVYTGDVNTTPEQMVSNVSQNLKMDLVRVPRFVFLHQRKWVEAERYPVCTLLGQSVGSVVLGIEALIKCTPDYFIDTMGYSFTYPLFKVVAGCSVASYTHYPTISSDMLHLVSNSDASYNNRPLIARSPLFTTCKLLYYHLFAIAYGFSGRFADLIMVNSHWTRDHIISMWRLPQRTHLMFPPCDTSAFQSLSLEQKQRFTVVSVAQFRPEKDHKTQLLVFKRFTEMVAHEPGSSSSQLVLIGSCRNQEDEERVADLRLYAQKLGLGEEKVSNDFDSFPSDTG